MTTVKSSGPPEQPAKIPKAERLGLDEFRRLAGEAERRGEPTAPLIKLLVLSAIDEVQESLEARGRTGA